MLKTLRIKVKALYTSDLHGEIYLYEELLALTTSSFPEIVVLGGDLLPSFPPTKRYEDMVPSQKTFINQFLFLFFKRMVESTTVKQVFLIPGNWDLGYSYLFREPKEEIIDLSQKTYQLKNGYQLIGYPFVPPTPFRPKDYEKMDDEEALWPPQKNPSYIRSSEQNDQLTAIDPHLYLRERGTIREDLYRFQQPPHQKKAIHVMHSPPFGTRLDSIQGGKYAGSRSIRNFIEVHQPLLTLHGHIHESPELTGFYFERLGETLSINPGQFGLSEKRITKLHAVTFEIEKVKETLIHTCFPA